MANEIKAPFNNLYNKYVYQEFLMHRSHIFHFNGGLQAQEYMVLEYLYHHVDKDNVTKEKTYLKDLASSLEFPMSQVSSVVKTLSDKNYVIWTHDDDGKNGTYVIITEMGKKLIEENEEKVKDTLGKAIEEFGEERMNEMLSMMKEFTDLLAEI